MGDTVRPRPFALARFGFWWCQYLLHRRVCSAVTRAHVRARPTTSTPSTLSDIALEQTALWQRRLDQRCHVLKQRYEQAGKEYLHDKKDG